MSLYERTLQLSEKRKSKQAKVYKAKKREIKKKRGPGQRVSSSAPHYTSDGLPLQLSSKEGVLVFHFPALFSAWGRLVNTNKGTERKHSVTKK